jgi:hypothetical protein
LTFTAVVAGAAGNAYTVAIEQPVTLNAVLTVTLVGTDAVINLPTDGAGVPVAATATEVKVAWDASAAVAAMTVVVEGTGAGAVDAAAEANLTTGADAIPGTGTGTGARLYVDYGGPALYINEGTAEEPNWTAA